MDESFLKLLPKQSCFMKTLLIHLKVKPVKHRWKISIQTETFRTADKTQWLLYADPFTVVLLTDGSHINWSDCIVLFNMSDGVCVCVCDPGVATLVGAFCRSSLFEIII